MAKTSLFQDVVYYDGLKSVPSGRLKLSFNYEGNRYTVGVKNDPDAVREFLTGSLDDGFTVLVKKDVLEIGLPEGKTEEGFPLLSQLEREWKRLNGPDAQVRFEVHRPLFERVGDEVRPEEGNFIFSALGEGGKIRLYSVKAEIEAINALLLRLYDEDWFLATDEEEWRLEVPVGTDLGLVAYVSSQVRVGLWQAGLIGERCLVRFRFRKSYSQFPSTSARGMAEKIVSRSEPDSSLMREGHEPDMVHVHFNFSHGEDWSVSPTTKGLQEAVGYFSADHPTPPVVALENGNWAVILPAGSRGIKRSYGFIARGFTEELRSLGVFTSDQQVDLLVRGGIDISDEEAERLIQRNSEPISP